MTRCRTYAFVEMDGVFASYHVRNGGAAGGFFGGFWGGLGGRHFGRRGERRGTVSEECAMPMLMTRYGEEGGEYLANGRLRVYRGWRGERVV